MLGTTLVWYVVAAPTTNIVVSPLTKAMWNQGRHYNRMAPVTSVSSCPDGRMWAGCTAVATAIVMKYYEWPKEGETYYQTLNSEAAWENDYTSTSLRARFYRPYEWSKMQDVYGNVTSGEASLAVGELMSDIGAVMFMNYGTSGSSTLRDNVIDVLEHNFHFDASELYHVENSTFTPEVEERIQKQLKDGHPIISAGAAGVSGTGHTYVCDGIAVVTADDGTTKNLYHFNFGWGGTSNGWYPLDAVFTAAKPGEAAVERPVQDMFLGVYPQRAPQILSAPSVTGPEVKLDWAMATCWTNQVTGFRIERQDRTVVQVNQDLTDAWGVRSSGWGWEMSGGVPVATSKTSYMGNWPTQGVSANTTKGIAVSSDTTITIKYRARKFPSGVTLSLIKSDAEGSEWDSSTNRDLPTLANLPGGTSTTAFEEKTVTVSGSTLANTFGLEPAYFALRFKDPNEDKTYYGSTEVFKLVSFTVTGEGEGWETTATQTIPASSRTYTWSTQPTGDHKFVLTALYPAQSAVASVVKTVRASAPVQPVVSLSSAAGNTLMFNVANTSEFSYKFETQSNIMRGTGAQNGNTITYTFANDVTQVGTHWIALTVTDNATGSIGRYVHITNVPTDHPLCAYTEQTLESAVARAKREGKLVLMMQSGDPDAAKFLALSGILSSNEVVSAVAPKFIVTETLASVPGQQEIGKAYWREQPQYYGQGKTSYLPAITAYAVVINPETPSVPYPCDMLPGYYMNTASRWNYFNSQYDMQNIGYAYYIGSTTANLVKFLGQTGFVVTADPEPEEPEPPEEPEHVVDPSCISEASLAAFNVATCEFTGTAATNVTFDIGADATQEITGTTTAANRLFGIVVRSGMLNFTLGDNGGNTTFRGRVVTADGSNAVVRLAVGDGTGWANGGTMINLLNGGTLKIASRDTLKTPVTLSSGNIILESGCATGGRALDLFAGAKGNNWKVTGGISRVTALGTGNSRKIFIRDGDWNIEVAKGAKLIIDADVVNSGIGNASGTSGKLVKTGEGELVIFGSSGAPSVHVGTNDLTGAFKREGETIVLDANGSVQVGTQMIAVTPVWAEGSDALAMDGESVSLTIQAIPGLRYQLLRSAALDEVFGPVGDPITATSAALTLEDLNPPSDSAFYKVRVLP